jgi:hypothetical protein
MMVALIPLAVRRVDRDIDGNTIAINEGLGEVTGDLHAIRIADLRGQRGRDHQHQQLGETIC